MENDSIVISQAVSAIFAAQRQLLEHTARIWVTYSHQIGKTLGRETRNSMTNLTGSTRSTWMICEAVTLDATRELQYFIDIGFAPSALTVSGGVHISEEVRDGYAEEEIMTLPAKRTVTVPEFTAILNDYVGRLCSEPGIRTPST